MPDGFRFERARDWGERSAVQIGIVGLLAALSWLLPSGTRAQTGASGPRLAVASEAPRASEEAMSLLKDSGNAVDAAVAAALVAGVVSPSSSGIGGGGFVNYWDSKTNSSTILDFRECAPAQISVDAFEQRPFDASERGKYTGVPGEVRGLHELHRRFGKLPWKRVVMTASRVAGQGFSIRAHMHSALGFNKDKLKADPGLSSLWMPRGKNAVLGQWVKNPRLEKTLEAIAESGPNAFYEGPIASEIVETARAFGSEMTLDDLRRYEVKERQPIIKSWNGFVIYTMPAPSAGGYMLAQTAKLFEPDELSRLGPNSPAYVHALAEGFRAAISDRVRYFGDPDHINVELDMLLGDERMRRRRERIALDRTHALPRFGLEEYGTHHLVTADAEGNVVSLTTTVNTAFGADLMTMKSGIVLNDELNDFSKDAWVRPFGLGQSLNRPRPFARPVSSMTPTIVTKDGRVVLAAGGSGGMNIATDVSQAVIQQLLFAKSPREVVDAPRFQIPLFGGSIRVPKKLGPGFVADLEARGEIVETYESTFTAVQILRIENGVVSAAADPQKHGRAIVR